MLKSYWTVAWRGLRPNKVSSIINIGGLMLGLTSGIIICLYVIPFTFRFINDEHQELFVNDAGISQMANIFGGMAILISCLGLFGLAGFLVEKRTKEISIRKVLGATPGRPPLAAPTAPP